MPVAQKIGSGLLGAAAGCIVFGFVIGMVTPYFVGGVPGAILGGMLGFRWGYARVGATSSMFAIGGHEKNFGSTAFLAFGLFTAVWLSIVFYDVLGGYTAPFRGHPLTLLPLALIPATALFGARLSERLAQRHLPPVPRNLFGIILIVLLYAAVALWWRWAEARDQAAAGRSTSSSQRH